MLSAGGLMTDVLTSEQRRRNMSRIRGRDTKPEMLVRKGLHALGLRFRLQDRSLPGRPDLIFPKYRTVILVHGCFWHGHDCPMFRLPATRPDFWRTKINANQTRDQRTHAELLALGWRILTIWECALKGTARWQVDMLFDTCVNFIRGTEPTQQIAGRWQD